MEGYILHLAVAAHEFREKPARRVSHLGRAHKSSRCRKPRAQTSFEYLSPTPCVVKLLLRHHPIPIHIGECLSPGIISNSGHDAQVSGNRNDSGA